MISPAGWRRQTSGQLSCRRRWSGLVPWGCCGRPQALSRNDPVPDTVAERQAAVLILIATDPPRRRTSCWRSGRRSSATTPARSAFPGGAREDGDAGPPETAIREAAEETGVDPAGIEALLLLPRVHIPPSQFDVTGVLAHWRTPSPVSAIDPGESRRVMRVPFTALADPENRIMLKNTLRLARPRIRLDGVVVWGYTGEILATLLRLRGLGATVGSSGPARSRPGVAAGRLSSRPHPGLHEPHHALRHVHELCYSSATRAMPIATVAWAGKRC